MKNSIDNTIPTLSQLFPTFTFDDRARDREIKETLDAFCTNYPEFVEIDHGEVQARTMDALLTVRADTDEKDQLVWCAELTTFCPTRVVSSSDYYPTPYAALRRLSRLIK